jgi:uncharacterized protein (TIGR03083 family)
MDSPLAPLRGSVGRLHQLCRGLDDAQLGAQSYCRDWSIAGTLSHLGSGAVIMRRRLEDVLAGRPTPDDFAPSVWDEWNAKSARAKADDALVADEAVLEALEAVSAQDRARVTFPMGPLALEFDQFAAMRLNEHAFHTWDIEVVFDDGAHLPHDVAAVVVDNLGLIARFSARPTGEVRTAAIRTSDPARDFTVRLSADSVELVAGEGGPDPDLVLPAEAFCRLVYGRLDPEHTPAFTGDGSVLDTLRAVFPGP